MRASDFSPLISVCCAEVLDAMYFTTVLDTVHHSDLQPGPSHGNLAYTLRFEGDVHGTFGLSVPSLMASTLASNFLGEDEEAMSHSEISEVVGELANMLCGSVVSRIDSTHKFILSHPEPFVAPTTHGDDPPEDIIVSVLTTDTGELQTWIIVDEGVTPDIHPNQLTGRLSGDR